MGRPTKELIEQNKRKQLALRDAGINVKVDGSWGPWLELQYRKISANRSRLANAAVLALPAAGYGVAQLLEGIGTLPSISLPSAPALAMSAPIALTLAGPGYGLYETITGQHHGVSISPEERLANAFAADATKVNRPISISTPIPRALTRLQGEEFINPVLTRPISISMASETTLGSTTVPRDSATPASPSNKPKGKQKGKSKNKPKDEPKNIWQKLKEALKTPTKTSKTNKASESTKTSSNFVKKHPLLTGVGLFLGTSHPVREHVWKPLGEFWMGPDNLTNLNNNLNSVLNNPSDSAKVVPISSAPVELDYDLQSIIDSLNNAHK